MEEIDVAVSIIFSKTETKEMDAEVHGKLFEGAGTKTHCGECQ